MKAGTYVPPSMRGGGAGTARAGATMMDRRGTTPFSKCVWTKLVELHIFLFVSDDFTVRVTNLPEDTTDQDLKDLFSMTGKVLRIYLAKDKQTQRCKVRSFLSCSFLSCMATVSIFCLGVRFRHLRKRGRRRESYSNDHWPPLRSPYSESGMGQVRIPISVRMTLRCRRMLTFRPSTN